MTRISAAKRANVAVAVGAWCAAMAVLTACTSTGTPEATPASPSAEPSSTVPVSAVATTTTPEKEAPVHVDSRSLWDVVAAVADQMPVSSDTLSQALGTPLNQDDDTGESWSSGQIQLGDSVVITSTELRSAPEGQWHGLAILTIGGECQNFDLVKTHYPDLKLSEVSPHAEAPITYSTTQPWGRIGFGFYHDMGKPKCLKGIVFRTR